MQNFFRDNVGRCRSRERGNNNKNKNNKENEDEVDRRTRAVTPGRQLLLNLKPVGSTRSNKTAQSNKQSKLVSDSEDCKNDYTKHFKVFMSSTSSVKRVRSFSQPRDKDAEEKNKSPRKSYNQETEKDSNTGLNKVKVIRKNPARKPSFEKKCVEDRNEKENKSKDLMEPNSTNIHRVRQRKAASPSPSECSMTSSLSSMSKEYGVPEDKPVLEQDNKEVEACIVRKTSTDSGKDLPPQPSYKPKHTIESATSNYNYYVRIRSRAGSRAFESGEGYEDAKAEVQEILKEYENHYVQNKDKQEIESTKIEQKANEDSITTIQKESQDDEKKDSNKEEKGAKASTTSPKAKPKTRSRATTKKSQSKSNEKSSISQAISKSKSQSTLSSALDSTTASITRKKPRSKTVDKDPDITVTISRNNCDSSDISQNSTIVHESTIESQLSCPTSPRSSSVTPNQSQLDTFKTSDNEVNSSEIHKTFLPGTRDTSSEKTEKTMVAARSTLLLPMMSTHRRRSSNNSISQVSSFEGGSDSNNNDTTPRPSPCKYSGSLSNSSIHSSSPRSSCTSVVCATTTNENEKSSMSKRKTANKIYDRSDSNSSYKSNGCGSTLVQGNGVENHSNESLDKERKQSLSNGVGNNIISSNYNTNAATYLPTKSSPIANSNNNKNDDANPTVSNASPSNSTSAPVRERDNDNSERRQRFTYRRSRTQGSIPSLNTDDSNDNRELSEKGNKRDVDNNTPSSSVNNSSVTKETSSRFRAANFCNPKNIGSALHYSTYRQSYGMRAKSECNLAELNDNEQYRSTEDNRSNATSSRETNSYGLSSFSSNRENQFLSAAKKWASYDKTPYISPFARDSWKRTHRKFNYSRFLNYTRETFV